MPSAGGRSRIAETAARAPVHSATTPKPVHPLEVGAVQFEGQRVVVDEEHGDHARLPGRITWNVVGE